MNPCVCTACTDRFYLLAKKLGQWLEFVVYQIADDKNMLIDVLHGLLDEGKVIAVKGMLQIKK